MKAVDFADPFEFMVQTVALPYRAHDLRLLETWVTHSRCAAVAAFTERVADRWPELTEPCAAVCRYVGATESFDRIWHPAFGALHQLQACASAYCVRSAAIEMALWASHAGNSGAWQVVWDDPAPLLLFSEQCLLRSLSVSVRDGALEVRAVQSDGTALTPRFPIAKGESGCSVRQPQLCAYPVRTEEDRFHALGAVDLNAYNMLAAGIALLNEGAPDYAALVSRLVRFVRPLQAQGSQVASWSSLHYPGLVSMTAQPPPLYVAETLVHEASHQAFHMLDQIIPLVDREAQECAYSPIKHTQRPIAMLLLSYHAFANVALLFRRLFRAGLLDRQNYVRHQRDLCSWLPQLEKALEHAHSLTAAGDMLWRTLQESVTPLRDQIEEGRF